jgi:Potato inhibitor I family
MIGGTEALHQGPWPECLDMSSTNCIRYIETYAEDLRISQQIKVVPPDVMVTMDFNPKRVRIYVNESDIVIQIPRRG